MSIIRWFQWCSLRSWYSEFLKIKALEFKWLNMNVIVWLQTENVWLSLLSFSLILRKVIFSHYNNGFSNIPLRFSQAICTPVARHLSYACSAVPYRKKVIVSRETVLWPENFMYFIIQHFFVNFISFLCYVARTYSLFYITQRVPQVTAGGRIFTGHSLKGSAVASLSFNIILVLCVYTCKFFSPTTQILSCILTSLLNLRKLLVKNLHVQLQVYKVCY